MGEDGSGIYPHLVAVVGLQDLVDDSRRCIAGNGTMNSSRKNGKRGAAKMRVLITGGAGFIGSHLADGFLEQGYRVRILDNLDPRVHPPGASVYIPSGV